MTPQTPQGAALSDADIEAIGESDECVPYDEEWHYRFARAVIAADRRLTAEGGADDAMNRDVSSMSRKELEQTVGSLRVAVIERAFNALPQPQAEPVKGVTGAWEAATPEQQVLHDAIMEIPINSRDLTAINARRHAANLAVLPTAQPQAAEPDARLPEGWKVNVQNDTFRTLTITAPNGYSAVTTNVARNPENVLRMLVMDLIAPLPACLATPTAPTEPT